MTEQPATDDSLDLESGTGDPQLAYADALAELEEILAALERDVLDVDVLGDRVARAAVLIRTCRARIDRARFEVERVVTDLGPSES